MEEHRMINGVDVDGLAEKIHALQGDPDLARFHFRVSNQWMDGGHNQTTINDFDGVGQRISHQQQFKLDADEPPVLLGHDQGANPVEHLLNALAACLTSSLVYHAAARGIQVEEVESSVEGDLDIQGFMGISDKVRKGYQNIQVNFRVKSDADEETLKELAQFSPVFDTVSNGTKVELKFEKK